MSLLGKPIILWCCPFVLFGCVSYLFGCCELSLFSNRNVLSIRNVQSRIHRSVHLTQFQCQTGWMRKKMLVSITGQRSLITLFLCGFRLSCSHDCDWQGGMLFISTFKALRQVMFSHLSLSLKWFGPMRDPFVVITVWLTSVVGSAVIAKMSRHKMLLQNSQSPQMREPLLLSA